MKIPKLDQLQTAFDSLDYKDTHLDFYSDAACQTIYTIWRNEVICLGNNNIDYKADAIKLIEAEIDLITSFDLFPGAELRYFLNGAYRDIGLYYKDRLLKVFLVQDLAHLDIEALVGQSIQLLHKILK